MTHSLITYGILRNRGTLERVIGRTWEGEYRTVFVLDWTKVHADGSKTEDYRIWYARPSKDGDVLQANLIEGLTDEDMVPLDRLEGVPNHYRRVEVEYLDENAEIGRAWLYVAGDCPPTDWEIHRDASARIREQTSGPVKKTTGRAARRQAGRMGQLGGYQSLEDLANSMGIVSPPVDSERQPWHRVASTGTAGGPTMNNGGISGRRVPRTRSLEPYTAIRAPGVASEPHEDLPLFAYGALTFREVLEERIKHIWPGRYRPAALVGWRIEPGWPRHAVQGTMDDVAHGFLLPNLTEENIRIIDRYEGCHNGVYQRVIVILEDGTRAYFYQTGPAGHRRLARRKQGTEPAYRPFVSGQKVSV